MCESAESRPSYTQVPVSIPGSGVYFLFFYIFFYIPFYCLHLGFFPFSFLFLFFPVLPVFSLPRYFFPLLFINLAVHR